MPHKTHCTAFKPAEFRLLLLIDGDAANLAIRSGQIRKKIAVPCYYFWWKEYPHLEVDLLPARYRRRLASESKRLNGELTVKLTDALLGEHGAFYALFDHVEEISATAGGIAQIQSAVTVLETMVLSHATLEEELLFTALEPHLGRNAGPLAIMHAEHEEIEVLLSRIEEAASIGDAVGWVERALNCARSHFKKEEEVLFPMALNLLGEDTLRRLGREWSEARHVSIA